VEEHQIDAQEHVEFLVADELFENAFAFVAFGLGGGGLGGGERKPTAAFASGTSRMQCS
jgi:hypothetical protein